MNDPEPAAHGLSGEHLRVRYHAQQPPVVDDESILVPIGKITALIGPNGSGKSTLLKILARQLVPEQGRVILDGKDIATMPGRELARKLGILFQENVAPGDISVEDLAFHGRYPHRKLFEVLTLEDDAAVNHALKLAGVEPLRHRPISQLSGGQRQLAWVAMVLAQAPAYLFLDEPTTFLDLAHQLEVMAVIRKLNLDLGKTIILVVHDLNLAARYADHLCAMRDGRIVATGSPVEVLTASILRHVFNIEALILHDEFGQVLACNPIRVIDSGPGIVSSQVPQI